MCLLDKAQWDALLGLSLSTEGLFLSEEASIPEYKALGNLPGKMSGGMPAISSGKGEGARAASSSDRKVVLKGLMVKSLLIIMFFSREGRDLGVAFQDPPGCQASSRGEAKDSAVLLSRDADILEPPSGNLLFWVLALPPCLQEQDWK